MVFSPLPHSRVGSPAPGDEAYPQAPSPSPDFGKARRVLLPQSVVSGIVD